MARSTPVQVAPHEGDVGRLDGHVGPGPHGDADVGLGQGRGVVDAVADHRDHVALGLQRRDGVRLARRQDAGDHPVDPDLAGDGLGRPGRVAGQHDDRRARRP